MQFQNILVGADPEFFLHSQQEGFVGAFKYLKGTKWIPETIGTDGSAILHDNVMVEFNIAPARTADEFVGNINKVLSHIRLKIPNDVDFTFLPSAHFELRKLRSKAAKTFGCEPDFNAWWEGKTNPPVNCEDRTLRTSGGHIHVGFDEVTREKQLSLIQHMDVFLGVPSILMDKHGDERRKMYGKAGACRFKPYGAEYRVLSNFWLQSDELKKWAFNATIQCTEALNAGFHLDGDKDVDAVLEAINNNNKQQAEYLVKKYNLTTV